MLKISNDADNTKPHRAVLTTGLVSPEHSISTPGAHLPARIDDLGPAQGPTAHGPECFGLELLGSFWRGRIHRIHSLGTAIDAIHARGREFHVVKIDTKLHFHRHAYTALRETPNGVPADLLIVKTRGNAWQNPVRHAYDGLGTGGERCRGSQRLP